MEDLLVGDRHHVAPEGHVLFRGLPRSPGVGGPPRHREIIWLVARFYGVRPEDLVGSSRHQHLVEARHVAQYLIHELTDDGYQQIGRTFGRDHTSVMYGVRKITEALERPWNETLRAQAGRLRREIRGIRQPGAQGTGWAT